MATITTRSNQFEDSATITLENGQVIEAAICHIPGSDATFNLGTYDSAYEPEETYQVLASFPVQAE